MAKGKVRNAFNYNNIMSSLNRVTNEWSHSLCIHGKGKFPCSIELTDEQFNELKEGLELKEEPSLTSDTGKVFIINP